MFLVGLKYMHLVLGLLLNMKVYVFGFHAADDFSFSVLSSRAVTITPPANMDMELSGLKLDFWKLVKDSCGEENARSLSNWLTRYQNLLLLWPGKYIPMPKKKIRYISCDWAVCERDLLEILLHYFELKATEHIVKHNRDSIGAKSPQWGRFDLGVGGSLDSFTPDNSEVRNIVLWICRKLLPDFITDENDVKEENLNRLSINKNIGLDKQYFGNFGLSKKGTTDLSYGQSSYVLPPLYGYRDFPLSTYMKQLESVNDASGKSQTLADKRLEEVDLTLTNMQCIVWYTNHSETKIWHLIQFSDDERNRLESSLSFLSEIQRLSMKKPTIKKMIEKAGYSMTPMSRAEKLLVELHRIRNGILRLSNDSVKKNKEGLNLANYNQTWTSVSKEFNVSRNRKKSDNSDGYLEKYVVEICKLQSLIDAVSIFILAVLKKAGAKELRIDAEDLLFGWERNIYNSGVLTDTSVINERKRQAQVRACALFSKDDISSLKSSLCYCQT